MICQKPISLSHSCRPPVPALTGNPPREVLSPSGHGISRCYNAIAIAGHAGIANFQGFVKEDPETISDRFIKDIYSFEEIVSMKWHKAKIFTAGTIVECFDSRI